MKITTIWGPALVVLALSGTLLGACGRSTDLPPSLIAQADQQAKSTEAKASPELGKPGSAVDAGALGDARTGYIKREGLHIDLPYLAGRNYAELSESVVQDQLGALVERSELPENEDRIVHRKAEIWLYDGRIYRIRKQLEHSMDLPTALGTSGFPLSLGAPIEASNELRWNNTWTMKRIRLMKAPNDERYYTTIEVYRFMPKELF